jgi:tetraacyldisaccharide 4'-kinase
MASEAPPFWWSKPDWRAWALYPASAAYGAVAARRMVSAPRVKVDVPTLCVGNFTVGGAGKTPVAIALAGAAKAAGFVPGLLSRGYGGAVSAPHRVDPHHDSARHVGDEPLLLAEAAPTVVAARRLDGARELIRDGCDFLILDDGFQTAHLHFDYALLVVDANRGLGNGHVIPGGPIRAPLVDQLRHADAVLRLGSGEAGDHVVRLASRAGRPVFDAGLEVRRPEDFRGRRFLAFAGIGNPEKFFDSARQAEAVLVETKAFPDHHPFQDDEMAELATRADKAGLALLTTAKDAVRLRTGTRPLRDFAARLSVLEVEAVFDPPGAADQIVRAAYEAWHLRSTSIRSNN